MAELDNDEAQILELSHRMVKLLEDPHPGLTTWHAALLATGFELRDALDKKLPIRH